MKISRRQLIWTIALTILFYITARLGYEYFYRSTLNLIRYFSGDKITFFGKFPFWFFGDPIFGLVFCSIPMTFFLCYLILKDKFRFAFNWTVAFYLPLLTVFYLVNCFEQSIQLVASNDFYKKGCVLTYNLRQVDLNSMFLSTIIPATLLTGIINFIKRYRVTKNGSLRHSVLHQQGEAK